MELLSIRNHNRKLRNLNSRRDFLKVIGLGALTGGLAACKKKLPTEPDNPIILPTNDEYYIDVYRKDMTSLEDDNFVTGKYVTVAKLFGQLLF